jgi:hypothetical protein
MPIGGVTLGDAYDPGERADPPYLHPPVTASVFWVRAPGVQEFDKGRGP